MKRKKLGLVHTSATNVPVFQKLCNELLPNVDLFNIADDSLIQDVIGCGSLTPHTSRRLMNQICLAEQAGADVILVTCSSVGPAVEASAIFASVPVLRVDQPMADHAISIGTRIGVLATLETTLGPTADLIQRRSIVAKKAISITELLCEGAFVALLEGDFKTHDEIVLSKLQALLPFVDVVVLAQASMARVVDQLPEGSISVPVLSSPRLAVEHLALLMK